MGELVRREEPKVEKTMNPERGTQTREEEAPGSFLLARPAAMLKVEGAALLAASVTLYWANGGSWWLFALLFLAPDISWLGYLGGPKVGAAAYNAFHSYPLPAALGIVGLLAGASLAVAVALVWFAHIGMDRAFGYGLKYPTGFGDTHMGRL